MQLVWDLTRVSCRVVAKRKTGLIWFTVHLSKIETTTFRLECMLN